MRRVSAKPLIALCVLIGGVLSPPLLWGAALSAADSAFLQQLTVNWEKSSRLLGDLRAYVNINAMYGRPVDPDEALQAVYDAMNLRLDWDSVRSGSSFDTRELWSMHSKMIDQLVIAARSLYDVVVEHKDANSAEKIRPALEAAKRYTLDMWRLCMRHGW